MRSIWEAVGLLDLAMCGELSTSLISQQHFLQPKVTGQDTDSVDKRGVCLIRVISVIRGFLKFPRLASPFHSR